MTTFYKATASSDGFIQKEARRVLASWTYYDVLADMLAEFPSLELYLAGGALRDVLLNNRRPVQDVDLFFAGIEKEAIVGFLQTKGRVEDGPFGSPRWYAPEDTSTYADVIPIRSFHNGLWQCFDIKDVLNQFDFTGNAISLHLRTWDICDPQNSLRDLSARVMRAVRFDFPDEVISPQCPLTRLCVLWFRILHYAAELELTIEPVTKRWLAAHSSYESQASLFARYFFTPNLSGVSAFR